MNRIVVSIAALAVVSLPVAAFAKDQQSQPKPKVEVVQRDTNGRATMVSIDGQQYKLCSKTVTDSCINPRDAGFDWGGAELDYWPGKPASEIKGQLPQKPPEKAAKQD